MKPTNTDTTMQTTKARPVRAAQPLNGARQSAPEQAAPASPSMLPAPFPYPPEIEARRVAYEQVAETFSNLYDLHFRPNEPALTQIESAAVQVPQTDFIALIDQHMHSLFDEVNLSDRRTLLWLYPHLRLIVDAQKAEHTAKIAAQQAA